MYLREGANIPVSTMSDWVKVAHEVYLAPLAELILSFALNAYVMQVDDTGIKVRDKDSPRGARKGHLWPFLGDQHWLAFVYMRSWETKEIAPYLRERYGWLVADAYKGFDQIFALGSRSRQGAMRISGEDSSRLLMPAILLPRSSLPSSVSSMRSSVRQGRWRRSFDSSDDKQSPSRS